MQSYDQLISSGQVSAGNPDDSELIRLVAAGEMPPRGEVPAAQVETLRRWVAAGAKFDGPESGAILTSIAKPIPSARRGPVNRGDAAGYVAQGTGGYSGAEGDGYSGAEGDGYDGAEEMMDDYDTGYGDTGYGGGGGRRGGNPLVSLLAERLTPLEPSTLLAVGQAGDVPTGPVLSREAELAFAAGNLPVALQLHFGHMVAEYDQASEAIAAVRYSRALLRPVWHTRWGVSIMVRGEDSVDDLQPIEPGFATGKLRVASRGGRGGYGGGSARAAGGEPDYGDDYGDDYGGTEMADEMSEEIDYGDSLGEGMQTGRRPGRQAEPEIPTVEIRLLDPAARERIKKALGLVAQKMESEFGSRYRDGQFGKALTDVADVAAAQATASQPRRPGAPAQPGGFGAAAARRPATMGTGAAAGAWTQGPGGATAAGESGLGHARKLAEMAPYASPEIRMWTPGIVYLGEGSSQEMTKTAQDQGLDLLLHFDVAVKSGRDELVQNLSRCRVVHVASGKTVGVSKALDSLEAMRLVDHERTTEEEYVAEQLQNLLSIIDDKLTVIPMPKLTPEVAKRRVGSLIGNPGDPPLRTLAEIRLYQSQGLLNDQEVEAAFEIIAGDDGLVLLHGALEQKLAVIRRLAGTP